MQQNFWARRRLGPTLCCPGLIFWPSELPRKYLIFQRNNVRFQGFLARRIPFRPGVGGDFSLSAVVGPVGAIVLNFRYGFRYGPAALIFRDIYRDARLPLAKSAGEGV